jgi:transcriptional regulator with XRE-family HTH domain
MKKTNFDKFLQEQLEDRGFAERFERAGEAWEIAIPLARLREQAGLSQKELADRLRTSQQQISRLESPSYEGHSLRMLRRVAKALNASMRICFEPLNHRTADQLAETPPPYIVKKPVERHRKEKV